MKIVTIIFLTLLICPSAWPADSQTADHLYSTWKSSNQTDLESAYKAGKELVVQHPKDPRAAKVKKWLTAYEKIMPSGSSQQTSGHTPQMIVIPGKHYEIGKYEVTQAEWRALMNNNPSKFTDNGDNSPVEMVSWNDVQEYIQKLNAKTGRKYRLPSEVEWEYACLGGNHTEYCGSNDIDSVAWHKGNSNNSPHPSGQKQANSFGIYDMSGNVWEWMSDCWEGDCTNRTLRGGSWLNEKRLVRAEFRYRNGVAIRDVN